MEDKTKFLKARHENQGPRERNEGQEKKNHRCQTVARLGRHATSIAAPHPCASDETTIWFFWPP
jgi:hypothetical protein